MAAQLIASAAAELAAAGWRIFPLKPGSKLPAITEWPARATNDAATVAAWWQQWPDAGIGIATGGGLAVLDIDCKDGAPGYESLRALEADHGPVPATLTVETPSGGRHYYLAAHGLRNSTGRLGAGIDVRGDGGYVVAPPTVVDGRPYCWTSNAAPAPAPAWIVEASNARAAAEPSASSASIEATPELVDDLRSALAVIPADDRTEWVAVGAALRALGDAGRDLWLEWSATSAKHDPDVDPDQWETLGHDSTGPAAVFAKAQRLGWDNPAVMRRASEIFGRQPIPGGSLRLVDVSNIQTATIRPPRFVVERIIPAGHVTLLGGHGGAGKSILALAIAAHVAAGVPWADLAVEGGPALFVSLEDPGELVRYRLRKVIAACGLEADAVTARLRIVDGTSAGALMSEQAHFGTRSLIETPTLGDLRALVGDASLVVVDNASDAFDGNENSRQQVRSFVRALADLGRPRDAAVMLLAHIDKNAARYGSNGNSYSGSSAWHNSARSRLALIHGKGGAIELRHEKSNLGPMIDPVRMAWVGGGVLAPLIGADATDLADDDASDVLAAIKAAIADDVDVSTARSGPSTTQRVLEAFPELPERLRGTVGREAFWAAVTTLQRSGRIDVEEYRDGNRNMRKRFCVSSSVRVSSTTDADQRTHEQGRAPSAFVSSLGGVGD